MEVSAAIAYMYIDSEIKDVCDDKIGIIGPGNGNSIFLKLFYELTSNIAKEFLNSARSCHS